VLVRVGLWPRTRQKIHAENHDSGEFGLLKQKRFAPFFATQFLGASMTTVQIALACCYRSGGTLDDAEAGVLATWRPASSSSLLLFSATRATGRQARQGDARPPIKVLEMAIMGVAGSVLPDHLRC
jgi:hypothetical protein